MFEAYFDESGSHKSALVTSVAGYVFESEQYKRFDVEWRDKLRRYGIAAFHMADCAHLVGEFCCISRKESSDLCRDLIEIIKRRIRIGIVVSISEETLRLFQPAGTEHGRGYVLCLQSCLAGIAAWVDKNKESDRVSLFFESGHKLQSLANRALMAIADSKILSNGINYGSHTFIGKKDAVGIQAADLLAWEWQAEWRNLNGSPRRPRRLSLNNLVGAPHIQQYIDFDNLVAIQALSATDAARTFRPISKKL